MAGTADLIADLLGFGGPSGNDGASSNWAAWEHAQIQSMLDTSADPSDISAAASAWQDLSRRATDIVTRFTSELNGIVSGGWRGAATNAAVAALGPINQWAISVAEAAAHTTSLMDASGSSVGQTRATMPPARSHDWGRSLRSFALSGPAGTIVDAVAQEQARSDAHTEAVRIMNSMYSAPLNDYRVAVPTYPQLADPTLRPPEQVPHLGAAPGLGQAGGSVSRHDALNIGGGGSSNTEGGGHADALARPAPPATAELQSRTSSGQISSADRVSGPLSPEPIGPRQPAGGQLAAAATAGAPIMATAASGDTRRARQVIAGVAQPDGGRVAGGVARGSAGNRGTTEFGPRPVGAAVPAEDSRMGAGLGRGASSVPGGRAGDLVPPITGGSGQGGADAERRRPSYLIELDDIFSDGRKVAPPVIGEDPPMSER